MDGNDNAKPLLVGAQFRGDVADGFVKQFLVVKSVGPRRRSETENDAERDGDYLHHHIAEIDMERPQCEEASLSASATRLALGIYLGPHTTDRWS